MATYPSGVFAPSAKANGQVIDAGTDNAQDAEITAIEDALKNGLAHNLTISTGGLTVSTGSVNIAGPSSLTTLQVNGASTFAGAVTMSSGLTVTGAVSITGVVTATNIRDVARVRVTHSAPQAITAGAWVGLSWDTETYDSTGMHSTAVNSSRITFAGTTGVYTIGAMVKINVNGGPNGLGVRVLLNSTTEIARHDSTPGLSTQWTLPVVTDYRISDTSDFVTVEVFHDSASTCSVSTVVTSAWAHLVSL